MMYGDPLPIHLAGNFSSKNVRTILTYCGGAHLIFSCEEFKDKVYRIPVCYLVDLHE